MFKQSKTSLALAITTGFMTACGGGGGGGGGDNTGGGGGGTMESLLEITLRADGSAGDVSNAMVALADEQNCTTPTPELGPVAGACLSPEKISGTVANVSLGRQVGGPPARLLGEGIGLNNGGRISAQAFDLADPTALEGEDNLQDDDEGSNWDMVSVWFSHLDVQFELNDRYWTVRHGFIAEPIIEDAVIDECIQGETQDEDGEDDEDQGDNVGGYRQDLIENGYLIEGASFQKGDLLFCVKDDASACAVDEFQWLDLAGNTLVDTRPAVPRQVEVIADHVTTCAPSADGPGYDTNLGGFNMFALVSDPFSLSAEIRMTTGDDQAGPEPVKVYTFARDGEEEVEGSEMTVYVDFDVSQSVFFPGMNVSDLATATDAEIAATVFLKPLYIKDNAPMGTGYDPGVSVDVNATLSGETPP